MPLVIRRTWMSALQSNKPPESLNCTKPQVGFVLDVDPNTMRCWDESSALNEGFRRGRESIAFKNATSQTRKRGVHKGGRQSEAETEGC